MKLVTLMKRFMTDPKLIKRIVRIMTLELKKEHTGRDIVGVMGHGSLRPWQYNLVHRIERELQADTKTN